MKKILNKIRSRLIKKPPSKPHADQIRELLNTANWNSDCPCLIETGAGLTTIAFSEFCSKRSARFISCDYNQEKVDELRTRVSLDNVEFRFGDSLTTLREVASQIDKVHFLYLDSAASALHTQQRHQLTVAAVLTCTILITMPSAKQTIWYCLN